MPGHDPSRRNRQDQDQDQDEQSFSLSLSLCCTSTHSDRIGLQTAPMTSSLALFYHFPAVSFGVFVRLWSTNEDC